MVGSGPCPSTPSCPAQRWAIGSGPVETYRQPAPLRSQGRRCPPQFLRKNSTQSGSPRKKQHPCWMTTTTTGGAEVTTVWILSASECRTRACSLCLSEGRGGPRSSWRWKSQPGLVEPRLVERSGRLAGLGCRPAASRRRRCQPSRRRTRRHHLGGRGLAMRSESLAGPRRRHLGGRRRPRRRHLGGRHQVWAAALCPPSIHDKPPPLAWGDEQS